MPERQCTHHFVIHNTMAKSKAAAKALSTFSVFNVWTYLKISIQFFAAVLLSSSIGHASSATFATSTQPVKLVVGFGAGGGMDILARSIAIELSSRLQRPVYVENKVGAGGAIAAAYVGQSRADGNTLLLASPAEIFINQMFNPKLQRNGVNQLVPVARITEAPIVLVTTHDSRIHQITDIGPEIHNMPNGMSFASSGTGSSHHLAGEIFKQALGVELIHVPYSGGASATASLLGKQVDLLFAGLAPITPHLQSKKLRALAIASGHRSPMLPAVPTLKELGVEGFQPTYWQGFFLPKGASDEQKVFWSQTMKSLLQDPALTHKLKDMGYTTAYQEHALFTAFLRSEQQNYQQTARAAGFSD